MSSAVATQQAAPAIQLVDAELKSIQAAKEQAQLLAKSNLIPQTYQGNPANCLIAFNMARRLDADPLMVMQNLYILHGNPGWSSKFLIATFNQSPEYGAIRYQFRGTEGQDDWGCRAVARERETSDLLEGPWVDIAMAKSEGWHGKNGSKWQTMPELMLRYRAATLFIRTTAPEISMGLQTKDELEDIHDAQPNSAGVFEVVTEPAVGNKLDAFGAANDKEAGQAGVANTDNAEDADVIDPETGEVLDGKSAAEPEPKAQQKQTQSKPRDNWGAWTGGEPISGEEVFHGNMEMQLKLVESAMSVGALKRIFATQEEAVRALDDKDQLLLKGAYNKRKKQLS